MFTSRVRVPKDPIMKKLSDIVDGGETSDGHCAKAEH